MQSQCIQIVAFGGPDMLVASQTEVGEPTAGEARVRQTGIGVNYVDVYHRIGQLHGDGPVPPFIPGVQANGIVESVGAGVTDVAVGDRSPTPTSASAPTPNGAAYRPTGWCGFQTVSRTIWCRRPSCAGSPATIC